jgi:hypothetical protein
LELHPESKRKEIAGLRSLPNNPAHLGVLAGGLPDGGDHLGKLVLTHS